MSSREKQAPWVKWVPADFINGVFGLSAETIGVYSMILNLIYDSGGPIEDNVSVIARRLSMRPTSLEKRLAELVKVRKIVRTDGVISNSRAEIEIEKRAQKLVESRAKVGEKSVKTPPNLPEKLNGYNGNRGLEEEKNKNRGERDKKPAPPAPRQRAPKSVRIDPRRQLSNDNIVFARSRGLTKREIDFEWMKFVRYYAGRSDSAPNSKSPDWDAQWESWVLTKAHELNREPLVDEPANGKTDPAHWPRDVWARQIELWRKGVGWPDQFGPEPGQPGCLAPSDLVSLS